MKLLEINRATSRDAGANKKKVFSTLLFYELINTQTLSKQYLSYILFGLGLGVVIAHKRYILFPIHLSNTYHCKEDKVHKDDDGRL